MTKIDDVLPIYRVTIYHTSIDYDHLISTKYKIRAHSDGEAITIARRDFRRSLFNSPNIKLLIIDCK